jgi:hypothetical protein
MNDEATVRLKSEPSDTTLGAVEGTLLDFNAEDGVAAETYRPDVRCFQLRESVATTRLLSMAPNVDQITFSDPFTGRTDPFPHMDAVFHDLRPFPPIGQVKLVGQLVPSLSLCTRLYEDFTLAAWRSYARREHAASCHNWISFNRRFGY